MTLASPKSPNRARDCESIRTFACQIAFQRLAAEPHNHLSHPLKIPVDEVVIMKVLQSVLDVHQLRAHGEPMNSRKNPQPLAKSKGFCSGWFFKNPTMSPFSIHGVTIWNGCSVEVTPMNCSILS